MFLLFRLALLLVFSRMAIADLCYSCSSPQMHLKWPKDETTNKLLYLQEFPLFANESCESIRKPMPVVNCEDSVCIKAVIKQPPVERSICETGGAIVRDCWSRIFPDAVKNPRAQRDVVRLAEHTDSKETIGIIYTCDGDLCNFSSGVPSILAFSLPILLNRR